MVFLKNKFFLYFFLFIIFLFFIFFFERDLFLKLKILNLSFKEKSEIIKTLELYNKIFMDFYASSGNPALIDDFPTSKILKHEIFKEIGFLSSGGRVLVYDLINYRILNWDVKSSKEVFLKVEEKWNFQYQEIQERKPVSSSKTNKFLANYHLKNIKGKWQILEWSP